MQVKCNMEKRAEKVSCLCAILCEDLVSNSVILAMLKLLYCTIQKESQKLVTMYFSQILSQYTVIELYALSLTLT